MKRKRISSYGEYIRVDSRDIRMPRFVGCVLWFFALCILAKLIANVLSDAALVFATQIVDFAHGLFQSIAFFLTIL